MEKIKGGIVEDAEGFRYAYELSWNEGATLLCESVISIVVNYRSRQSFDVFHPAYGTLRVILYPTGAAVVMSRTRALDDRICDMSTESEEPIPARVANIIPFARAANG